jgi:glutathione S-transferase
MTAKLYVVPASHPCAAVEGALGLKGIPYDRVDLVPAMHKVLQKARFGGSTVPGVVLDGGRKVLGSRQIMRALEDLQPEPSLYPEADAALRRRREEAEEWGEQVLQPLVRRVIWRALSADTGAQLSYMEGAKLVPPTPKAVARLSGGAVAAIERRINDSTDVAVRADLINLPVHLDRVDRWIETGALNADGPPNAADLQIGSGVRLLLTLDDLAPLIDARPAGAHARRHFARYPGRTATGAVPADWLPAR